jgi:glycerophosphoryl diester phosphodiesterase
MRHPYFALPTPVVMGHRGAAGEVPENTLLSFETAVAQGATILESDVRATRDGRIVVFHDERVDRTTNGSGRVADHSLQELRALDGGYRFSPSASEVFPFRGRGLRIPTLEEAFVALPGMRFNLEVKEGDREVVKQIVEIVKRAGREELTLLTAGKDGVMATLRAHLAESGVPVAVGACPADVVAFIRSALDGTPAPPEPMALQIPAEFAGRPVVTPELVQHAHANDVHVHVWTINQVEEMQRLLDLGVDGIVTDFPARLAGLIARRHAGSQPSSGS